MADQLATQDPRLVRTGLEHRSEKQKLMKDTLIFCAGAAAFHTISHIWLGLSGMLPLEIPVPPLTVTQGLNNFIIVISAMITAGLLYGAKRIEVRE